MIKLVRYLKSKRSDSMSAAGIKKFYDLMKSDVNITEELTEAISRSNNEERLHAILEVAAQHACDFTAEEACAFFESSAVNSESDAEGEISNNDLDAVAGGAGKVQRNQDAVREGRKLYGSAFKAAEEGSRRQMNMLSSVILTMQNSKTGMIDDLD
jgi:hypothetical protein